MRVPLHCCRTNHTAHNEGGPRAVIPRQSMTQRYERGAELAGCTLKQCRVDTVFVYSNINEGN